LILLTLLNHQWKSFWRSRSAGKSVAVQILLGFIILYILSVVIGIGFYLKQLLTKTFPDQDVIKVFCGFLLYFFLVDILIRFMLQELPAMTIQPYLIQNIRRRQLIRFLNIRSLFTVINLFPILLFYPFTISAIGPLYGTGVMIGFLVALFFLTLFNHFLILYIKRRTIISAWWMAGFFATAALLGLCDYWKILSFHRLSQLLFMPLLRTPWLALLAVGMAVTAFANNYSFLFRNLYLDEVSDKNKRKESTDYAFLNRFGVIGELIALDMKLILRNKRPRSVVMLSGVFLFYGFILYKPEYIAKGMVGFLLLGGILITGIFISNYGQFLFAWQSSHFDGLMADRLSLRTYIKSKFMLFTAVCTVLLILSTLYGLMSWKIVVVQIAAYFYNVGVHTVMAVFFATRSYKPIDIDKKAAFNYQGLGASQWIYSLFVFLIPMAIYLPVSLLAGPWWGILTLGLVGLISLLLQEWWIDWLTGQFKKQKYLILDGFREK
jgi:Family of unknown function (DUF5687)